MGDFWIELAGGAGLSIQPFGLGGGSSLGACGSFRGPGQGFFGIGSSEPFLGGVECLIFCEEMKGVELRKIKFCQLGWNI